MWTTNHKHHPGARPGQLRPEETAAHIRWVRYNQHRIEADTWPDFSAAEPGSADSTLWIDIEGKPGLEGLRTIQERYGIHHLALEDVQNGGQNPRLDHFPDHLYLVLQLPEITSQGLRFHQLNLFLNASVVISIHDRTDLFQPIRQRLEAARGSIRGGGPEYLLYALADLAVDLSIPVTRHYSDTLLELENRVDEHDGDLSHEIYTIRRQLSSMLRMAQRQRDPLRTMLEADNGLISGRFEAYWRDCVDHAERLSENLNWLRDSAADLLSTHLALVSHRMNDVMKVLTIMSTVFVPLSFLVGLYGMNFDTDSPWNLPELGWRYGYPFVWAVMLTVVVGILLFFRHKRWF